MKTQEFEIGAKIKFENSDSFYTIYTKIANDLELHNYQRGRRPNIFMTFKVVAFDSKSGIYGLVDESGKEFLASNKYGAAFVIEDCEKYKALITKQAEQIKVLREALTDLGKAVFINNEEALKQSIINANKALEATKD